MHRVAPDPQDRLRPTASFRYEKMIDRYVLPHIGWVPLRSLTVTHLEDIYPHLRCSGRHGGGPLAPKTVSNVHQILRTALGNAERRARASQRRPADGPTRSRRRS